MVLLLEDDKKISENCLKLIIKFPSDNLLKILFICLRIYCCYFCYCEMLPNNCGRYCLINAFDEFDEFYILIYFYCLLLVSFFIFYKAELPFFGFYILTLSLFELKFALFFLNKF
jgi:hypothetical protein